LLFLIGGEALSRLLRLVPSLRPARTWQPALLALPVALFVGLTGAPAAYVQEWGYDQAFHYLRGQFQPAAGERVVTSMCTASMLYLGQCDAFAIQQGYEEYVKVRPEDGLAVDLWTSTPMMTTTAEFTGLLASAPRVWFVVDGWRFQTRYEPDFILTVLEQMDLVHNERGVMVFRGQGYVPLAEPAIWRQRRAEFDGALALDGFGLSSASPSPGGEMEITLNWQALEQVGAAYTAFLHLVAPNGTGVAGTDEPVLHGLYQPDLWPRDRILPDRHILTLPADLPPGRYRLDLGLYPTGQPDALLPVASSDHLPLAMLTVGKVPDPEPPSTLANVTFGDRVRLVGYDLDCDPNAIACSVQLHWEALAAMDRDYTVFVHLVGADGDIVTQDDLPPGDPFFGTSTWLPGVQVLDRHLLTSTASVPGGEYTIVAGLYYRPTEERLPAVDGQGNPVGDALPLATFSLGAESP
jgi:hypothetical protein